VRELAFLSELLHGGQDEGLLRLSLEVRDEVVADAKTAEEGRTVPQLLLLAEVLQFGGVGVGGEIGVFEGGSALEALAGAETEQQLADEAGLFLRKAENALLEIELNALLLPVHQRHCRFELRNLGVEGGPARILLLLLEIHGVYLNSQAKLNNDKYIR
jgi:hypothetical protein